MSNATPPVPRSVQRSFRLSAATAAQLDEVARGSDETRNSLVERLLMEALRRERHPMITFRTTGSGLRVAGLLGTRLDVHRVIETVKGEGGDASAAAAYLSSDETWVRAAIDYYADFTAEIDHRLADEARFSSAERDRWQRAQMLVS